MFAFLKTVTGLLALGASVLALPNHVDRRQGSDWGKAEVVYHCTKPNTAALTFDDGPFVYLYDVSKTLLANNATGTFFFNGNNWGGCIYNADQAKRVKYAYSKGHQVASHTWSHKDLSTLTWDQIHDEMQRSELAIERITGVAPAFTRPPYGSFNDLVLQAAYVRGQTLALWDLDSGDSSGFTADQSKQQYTDAVAKKPISLLALNHDVKEPSAHDVLPHAIATLKKAGYKLVTLAECLGKPAYRKVGPAPTVDPNWAMTQCAA